MIENQSDIIVRCDKEICDESSCCLYRHFDEYGQLLYVGISAYFLTRLDAHHRGSHWFREIKNVTVEWFSSRKLALEAEKIAISHERPLHNRSLGTGRPPKYVKLKRAELTAKLAQTVKDWRGNTSLSRAAQMLGIPVRTLEGVEQGRGFRYPQLLVLALEAFKAG